VTLQEAAVNDEVPPIKGAANRRDAEPLVGDCGAELFGHVGVNGGKCLFPLAGLDGTRLIGGQLVEQRS
jgi:hypothetical protein